MNPEAPFYPHKVRANPDRAFRKALFEGRLIEDDRRLIEEYIAEYQALRHIDAHRVLRTIDDLISRATVLIPTIPGDISRDTITGALAYYRPRSY